MNRRSANRFRSASRSRDRTRVYGSGDRPPAGLSKQAMWIIVLGVSITTVAVIALVVTRNRDSHLRSTVASTSATTPTAHPSPLRTFATLTTRFGPAVMVCGEEGMPACGSGTDLEFVTCSRALISFFHGYYEDAADARTAAFVGRPPPSGSRWSWGCGRDFRPTNANLRRADGSAAPVDMVALARGAGMRRYVWLTYPDAVRL
jgi:hypothetical protein